MYRAFLTALLTFALLLGAHAEPADPAGHWEGEIALAGIKLGIRIDLEHSGDTWSGTIDIPVQGLRGFKLEPVKIDGAEVNFAMPNISGNPAFAGHFDRDAGTISGDFTQAITKAAFKLERRARPAPVAGEMPAKGLPGDGLAGHWQALLKVSPVIGLRLSLEVTKTAAGAYEATLFSLDQTSEGIPVSGLTENAGTVTLKVPSIAGAYYGTLNADRSELAGEWKQGGATFPLTFKRVAEAPALHRPQDPKKPYPYREEEVTVPNPAAGIKLAGTLTLPPGEGPHPAVVLITGSGPQDRNESLMGHHPFLVLADHLTRNGIAVLRCDDRGIAQSTGDFSKAVTTDFADDALAAVAWLRSRKEIDPLKIGLIGHSEGGIVAPMAAVREPDHIAFIVLLAGVGVPMEQLLARQGADLARAMGESKEKTEKSVAVQRALFTMLKATPDDATAQKLALEIMKKQVAEYLPEERKAVGFSDAMIEGQSKMIATPWFRKLLIYDPRPTLRKVQCPVLALNGEKDLQVAANENLAGIQEALFEGESMHFETVPFPGLNHLFQTCTTGAPTEYGEIEETIAPIVLEKISSWIRDLTAK